MTLSPLQRTLSSLALCWKVSCSALPVPPPQPNLTFAAVPDPVGTVSPSLQVSGGYAEIARTTVGVTYTPHPSIGLGFDGTASGPLMQLYARPSMTLFLPYVSVGVGGSLGHVSFNPDEVSYLSTDATIRFLLGPPSPDLHVWMGFYGSYGAPLTHVAQLATTTTTTTSRGLFGGTYNTTTTTTREIGWTPSYSLGAQVGAYFNFTPTVDIGVMLYGFFGSKVQTTSPLVFFDAALAFSVRMRVPTKRRASSPSN